MHRVPPAAEEASGLITPRPAASLIVLRRSGPSGSPEILMGRRSAKHRFMPNVLVFPGGAVDPADFTAEVATPLAEAARVRLEHAAGPALGRALAIAAARELQEEVGLSLGNPPALDGLQYLCRAITPAGRPIRFDARFFVVDADRVTGRLAASAELEDPGWLTIADAGAANIAGATRAVLGQLSAWLDGGCGSLAVPVLRDRAWVLE